MNNIVLFSTDDIGGAGKAALRIMKALNRTGLNCKMLVKNKTSTDDNVIKIHALNRFKYIQRIKLIFERKKFDKLKLDSKYYYFGYKYEDVPAADISSFIDFVPDTIIVTWTAWFVSPTTIREFASHNAAKIIICPLDMSSFTGGCHYAWDCEGFKHECQNCPAILSVEHKHIAVNILKEKKHNWVGEDVKFWACSTGLYQELLKSALAHNQKIEQLLIPIDEKIFNNANRQIAKSIFNINDSKVILFGATFSNEKRKGIDFFIKALHRLYEILPVEQREYVKVLIAGRKNKVDNQYPIPFKVIDIDFINDDLLLAHLYQASDVLVLPTIQDSGPMMLNEAQMCGLPVVTFNVGAATDLVVNGISGYVCEVGNVEQMALGIQRVLFGSAIDSPTTAHLAFNKTSFETFSSFINQN